MNSVGLELDLQVVEVRTLLLSHIQNCEGFKRAAIWFIGGFAGLFLTINVSVFGYIVSKLDSVNRTQEEIGRQVEWANKTDLSDKADLTNRLNVIVQASIQRETALLDRFKALENNISELRQEVRGRPVK